MSGVGVGAQASPTPDYREASKGSSGEKRERRKGWLEEEEPSQLEKGMVLARQMQDVEYRLGEPEVVAATVGKSEEGVICSSAAASRQIKSTNGIIGFNPISPKNDSISAGDSSKDKAARSSKEKTGSKAAAAKGRVRLTQQQAAAANPAVAEEMGVETRRSMARRNKKHENGSKKGEAAGGANTLQQGRRGDRVEVEKEKFRPNAQSSSSTETSSPESSAGASSSSGDEAAGGTSTLQQASTAHNTNSTLNSRAEVKHTYHSFVKSTNTTYMTNRCVSDQNFLSENSF